MKLELDAQELAMVIESVELKVASLERKRKSLTGSLQLAYSHEANQANGVLVKLRGASNETKAGR